MAERADAFGDQVERRPLLGVLSHDEQIDAAALARKRDTPFTHDFLFHTLLGFLEVNPGAYRPELDILTGVRTYD